MNTIRYQTNDLLFLSLTIGVKDLVNSNWMWNHGTHETFDWCFWWLFRHFFKYYFCWFVYFLTQINDSHIGHCEIFRMINIVMRLSKFVLITAVMAPPSIVRTIYMLISKQREQIRHRNYGIKYNINAFLNESLQPRMN